jgi:rhodanese-related sulfurtransferase
MKTKSLIAAAAIALAVLVIGARGSEAQSIVDVDGPQAHAYVEDGAVLVDVRTPEEFAAGHIEGAINVPVQSLPAGSEAIPADRPVVVYCRSGARSARAAAMLLDAGWTQVYDLGPMSAW